MEGHPAVFDVPQDVFVGFGLGVKDRAVFFDDFGGIDDGDGGLEQTLDFLRTRLGGHEFGEHLGDRGKRVIDLRDEADEEHDDRGVDPKFGVADPDESDEDDHGDHDLGHQGQ